MLAALARRLPRHTSAGATIRGLAERPPAPTTLADVELLAAAPGATVDAYDADGFDLTGGLRIEGGALLAAPGGFAAAWVGVATAADVTPASLALARLVKPAPDIVIIGTGRVGGASLPRATVAGVEAACGVAPEVLPTDRAAALFNVLAAEGRAVVAGLVPAGAD